MSREFDFSSLPDNEFIIGWYPVYSFLQVSLLNFVWSLFLENGESYEEYIFQGAVKLISVVAPILNDDPFYSFWQVSFFLKFVLWKWCDHESNKDFLGWNSYFQPQDGLSSL